MNKFDLTQLSHLDYYKYLTIKIDDLSSGIEFLNKCKNGKIIKGFKGGFCEYKKEYNIPYNDNRSSINKEQLRFTSEYERKLRKEGMIIPIKYIVSGELKDLGDIGSKEYKYDGYSSYTIEKHQNFLKKYITDHMPILKVSTIGLVLGTCSKWEDDDKKEYEATMEQYKIDLRAWEEKMVKIKELQELYNDKEKYPDLPKPEKPESPTKIPFAILNKEGLKLLELYNVTHQQETIEASDKAKNYRWQLSNYIGQNITIDACIWEQSSNKVCLHDVYIGNKYVSDHMWIYNNIELFTPDFKEADRIVIEGKVYEYTNSEGLKNLSVSPTKIEKY